MIDYEATQSLIKIVMSDKDYVETVELIRELPFDMNKAYISFCNLMSVQIEKLENDLEMSDGWFKKQLIGNMIEIHYELDLLLLPKKIQHEEDIKEEELFELTRRS